MSTRDSNGTTLINHWQLGVPVSRGPVFTRSLLLLAALAALALALAAVRFFSPLGPFSGMNDAYAGGIWKTFNVMTLTALGSGPLALGLAAWVFNRQRLHVVMRTALVSGFLFYSTGLLALGFDVGRPWNFYSALLPWRWNRCGRQRRCVRERARSLSGWSRRRRLRGPKTRRGQSPAYWLPDPLSHSR